MMKWDDKKAYKRDPLGLVKYFVPNVAVHQQSGVHFTPHGLTERFIAVDVENAVEEAIDEKERYLTREEEERMEEEAQRRATESPQQRQERLETELKYKAFMGLVQKKMESMSTSPTPRDYKWLVFCNSAERVEQVQSAVEGFQRYLKRKAALFKNVELKSDMVAGQASVDHSTVVFNFAAKGRSGEDVDVAGEEEVKGADQKPRLHLLICTDVTSRGIDFADVDCVVQVDLGETPAHYLHRVGRTARAERTGEGVFLFLVCLVSSVQTSGRLSRLY